MSLRRLITESKRAWAGGLLAAAVLAASLAGAPPATVHAQQDGFSDVTGGVYKPAIDALARTGLFDGSLCGEDMFCPDEPIDRSTMAVWLIRALDGSEPPATGKTRFADIDAGQWWAPHVERLAELEITGGCKVDPLRYCPDRAVTRAQMAAFLSRAYGLPEAVGPLFVDVPEDAWYAADVAKLAASGITQGCGDGTGFCPDKEVTRAQMATFLARALNRVQAPKPPTFSAVSSSGSFACGLRTDETVTCWGHNEFRSG